MCSWALFLLPTVKSATITHVLETGLLPAINANKLQVLLGVAQFLLPISFLHDRFECVLIISTYCQKGR